MKKMKILLGYSILLLCSYANNSNAVDYSLTSMGIANPTFNFVAGSNVISSDMTTQSLLKSIELPWVLPIPTIRSVIPDNSWGGGVTPNYMIAFRANMAMPLTGYQHNGRTVFRFAAHRNLGFTVGLKDVNHNLVWMKDHGEYCVLNPSCGYVNIGNNDSAHLTLYTDLVYLPDPATDQQFDVESPKVLSGQILLGSSRVLRRGCTLGSCGPYPAVVTFDVFLNYTITLEPRACRLSPSSANQTIEMGPVSAQELNERGIVQRGNPIIFTFECPKYASVKAYFSARDANAPSSTYNYLTLKNPTSQETAKGVGIQLEDISDHSFIEFAPITPNKLIGETSNQSVFNYILVPYYKKTGSIQPGKIEANALVTFFYE